MEYITLLELKVQCSSIVLLCSTSVQHYSFLEKTALKLMSMKGRLRRKRERQKERGGKEREKERGGGEEREREKEKERERERPTYTLPIYGNACSHFARVDVWTIVWLMCAISDLCVHIRLVFCTCSTCPLQSSSHTHTRNILYVLTCCNRTVSV